jgi:hypothetical protein
VDVSVEDVQGMILESKDEDEEGGNSQNSARNVLNDNTITLTLENVS